MKVFLKTEHRFINSATNFQIIDSRFHESPPYLILDDEEANSMHAICKRKNIPATTRALWILCNNVKKTESRDPDLSSVKERRLDHAKRCCRHGCTNRWCRAGRIVPGK